MSLNPYASHLPILSAVASRCNGRILEVGGGFYSTPVLHGIAASRCLELTTVETHEFYFKLLGDLISDSHEIVMVSKSTDYFISEFDSFGMAFVDNDDCPRADIILHLKYKCPLIVAHDTEVQADHYGFNRINEAFKYRADFHFDYLHMEDEIRLPWTSVYSDTDDLNWLRKAFKNHGEL